MGELRIKSITRRDAIDLHDALCSISLGYLREDAFDAVLLAIEGLAQVKGQCVQLNEELHRRLYEGIDPARKSQCLGFMPKLQAMKRTRGMEQDCKALEERIRKEFPDVCAAYEKHTDIYEALLDREESVYLPPVDWMEFIRAVIKGNRKVSVAEIMDVFGILLERKQYDADMSEVEELLR